MRVEIISGNEAGVVKDLPQVEAEIAISMGFAKPAAYADGGLIEAGEPTLVGEVVSDFAIPVELAKDLGLPSAADLDAVAAEEAAKQATSGDGDVLSVDAEPQDSK